MRALVHCNCTLYGCVCNLSLKLSQRVSDEPMSVRMHTYDDAFLLEPRQQPLAETLTMTHACSSLRDVRCVGRTKAWEGDEICMYIYCLGNDLASISQNQLRPSFWNM